MTTESFITYRLRECLSSCLATAGREGLGIVSSAMEGILRNLDSPMQLAVIGRVSSSKSTLVNAILGKADIVGTGQMEETFNVSWLKYGPSDGDIKVVFKDGTVRSVPRREWKHWAGQEKDALKERVKYLEVTYEHEILKQVNIIDTPGLDSAKGLDSRNTIDFLTDVRPDAVLMVFTKGLAQSTLDVVKEFQGGSRNSFSLSPLNAVGLLAKTDFFWRIQDGSLRPNVKARSDVIEGSIYKLFPEVKESLFTILPISAMLGLASHTVDERDVDLLARLATADAPDLEEMLHGVNDFLDDFFVTDISVDERRYLYQKFGLYGVHEALELARSGRLDVQALQALFYDVSGMADFEDVLYSHFGQRSFLIKTQSASQVISRACARQRESLGKGPALDAVNRIQESVLACLMDIFEYKQLDFLTKIYENKMNVIDPSAVEEYKRVCGEYGASVVSKLGLSGEPSFDEMAALSDKKRQEWNTKYHYSYYSSPGTAELYRMLSSSYDMLAKDIDEVGKKAEEAAKVLKMANSFFYGK